MELEQIEKTLRPDYLCHQKHQKVNYVGLTPHGFWNLAPFLDDDYLSEWEIFKFKTLFKDQFQKSYIFPSLAFVVMYYASPYYLGLTRKNFSKFKPMKLGCAGVLSYLIYNEINLYPFPSKHFHELVTQPEPRGKYFRTVLKEQQPRKWALISKQLHEMGYNFQEMNEYSNKETMPYPDFKFDNTRR